MHKYYALLSSPSADAHIGCFPTIVSCAARNMGMPVPWFMSRWIPKASQGPGWASSEAAGWRVHDTAADHGTVLGSGPWDWGASAVTRGSLN